jgi:hypothetical protein
MGISNPKLKSMGMAFGLSALAAIGTMFLPVTLLEGLTGATGLSEIVPATAAPLGDTARALIAFGAGAFTLAVMAIVLLRKERDAGVAPSDGLARNTTTTATAAATAAPKSVSLMDGLKERMMHFKMPQMPWNKQSDDDILDLADLPKLRAMDAHPDAPARRPFSAGSDLNHGDAPAAKAVENDLRFWPERLEDDAVAIADSAPVPVMHTPATPVAEPANAWTMPTEAITAPVMAPSHALTEAQVPTEPMAPAANAAAVHAEPSLADLVNQLESAVTLRHQQLHALEMVAAQIKSEAADAGSQPDNTIQQTIAMPVVIEESAAIAEPVALARTERPPLEAVPTSQRKMADEDMDAALNAALETLQRMNAQGR